MPLPSIVCEPNYDSNTKLLALSPSDAPQHHSARRVGITRIIASNGNVALIIGTGLKSGG